MPRSDSQGWGGMVWAGIMLAGGLAVPREAGAQVAATTPEAGVKEAITKVLDEQTAAWNRGDLDGFLTGYWNSPKVVFMSGGTRHDGFEAMRDRYRKRYQADGRAMGQVTFAAVEIEPLGADAAMVRGRWGLVMADGTKPSGLFTLLFRRFDDGWKITHDHTSAAETTPEPTATPAPRAPDSAIVPTPAAPARELPAPMPPARVVPAPTPP